MSEFRIPLGAFELDCPFARGGSARVWKGVHREQAVPVAVKVLTSPLAREAAYLAAFRNETRAVTGLNHPAVVLVFDHGEVTSEAAELSDGQLVAGSPYLVMELASEGSLTGYTAATSAPPSWHVLRRFLFVLLDALAHAHAKGVIHRDLKPGNVLVCGPQDIRPGLKLSDFGLAHLAKHMEHSDVTGAVTGTPHYMAPEQLEGHFRDYGPPTDLYALGCLAFELATGYRAFDGATPFVVAHAHMTGKRADFMSRVDVPDGFPDWLNGLLERDARQRFQRAADAAWALSKLGGPAARKRIEGRGDTEADASCEQSSAARAGPAEQSDERPLAPASHGFDEDGPPSTQTMTLTWEYDQPLHSPQDEQGGDAVPAPLAARHSVPPLPQHWRRGKVADLPVHLTGVGLGLYGLRAIPMVDREPERDALWTALRRTNQEGRARLLLLEGPAGCGKTRLARWLCERAHELGSATYLSAVHNPIAGRADGLSPMVARHLGCSGLEYDKALARLEPMLRAEGVSDSLEWRGLASLAASNRRTELAEDLSLVHFESPEERYVLVLRLLQRVCASRPAVVWLDDVQWGLDALGFARYLLRVQDTVPLSILMLLTARDSALAERPMEASLLSELLERPESDRLRIDALQAEHRSLLVRALLGLRPDLAAQVAERTAGNPLFAVQLVGDWVERGVLELHEDGFALRPGVPVQLPDDLHQVWASRIERLLDGRCEEETRALELAAVLGQDVDTEEWRIVCARTRAEGSILLVETMLEDRLASAAEKGPAAGWSFVHGMLRESLLRRAASAGRLEAHHLACAEMLRSSKRRGDATRLGRHLLEGGEPEAALDPLADGVMRELQGDAFWSAEALLADRERALELSALRVTDERWGGQWLLRGQLAHAREKYDDAERWARRAEQEARAHGWTSVLAWVFVLLSECAMSRWEMNRCLELLAEAERHAGPLKDLRLTGECALKAGTALTRLGRFQKAVRRLREARAALEQANDRVGTAYCSYGLAVVHERAGQLDEAKREFARCRTAFEKAGSRRGMALSFNSEGELARAHGDLDAAEAMYHVSKTLFEAMSSWREWAPMTNLGLIRIAQKRFDEAREYFEEGLACTLLAGSRASAGVVHASLLPCFAASGDWESWDNHLSDATKFLGASGWVDPDIAETSSLAAEMARAAGQWDRAVRAYRLSEAQWRGIGRNEAAEAIAARLAELLR